MNYLLIEYFNAVVTLRFQCPLQLICGIQSALKFFFFWFQTANEKTSRLRPTPHAFFCLHHFFGSFVDFYKHQVYKATLHPKEGGVARFSPINLCATWAYRRGVEAMTWLGKTGHLKFLCAPNSILSKTYALMQKSDLPFLTISRLMSLKNVHNNPSSLASGIVII